ncbi:uncharacterized protein LOC135499222 [Lineus longissimus]|uniref:uncharacterized protein LOC135499222 n=1 Tax=Lineus longissimus TaxID=88925 RepID=UPI00315D0158
MENFRRKFQDLLGNLIQSPDSIRRDRLQEVRKANLQADKRFLDDLEKKLGEAKSTIDCLKSKIKTCKTDEINELSEELKTQRHRVEEDQNKKNLIKKSLDEEEDDAERQDSCLRNYLKDNIVDDKFEKLVHSHGVDMVLTYLRKAKEAEIPSCKTFIALWEVLKRLGIIETGNYFNLSSLLVVADDHLDYKCLIKEIEHVEDAILDRYDTKDEFSLSDFQKKDFLGSGAFGTVYAYQNIRHDDRIAVKEIAIPGTNKEHEALMVEVNILRELSKYEHTNIIGYRFNDLKDGKLYLGMEFMKEVNEVLWSILNVVIIPEHRRLESILDNFRSRSIPGIADNVCNV